jgi:hypothetical protein
VKPMPSIFGGVFSSSTGSGVATGSGSAAGSGSATIAAEATTGAGAGSTAPTTRAPTLEELKRQLYQVAQGLRGLYGDRAAVIIAIGVPNGAHDRFAAYATGPCLMERGLLHWAVPNLEEQMTAHVTEPSSESDTKGGPT